MKHYVYLAGPISDLTYAEATDWRQQITERLDSDKIECLSPMRGKQFLSAVKALSRHGYEHNAMSTEKGINRRDFFDCTRASCVLVNFLDATKVSIGTVMEVAWAFQARIPVVCVREPDNIHTHVMIDDCVTYSVPTLEEAELLIKWLLNEPPC